jgi:nucleotide-binding universal stress UspA family protein
MKRIIVPTDFSELSMSGLNLAVLLAPYFKAKIELVHVINKAEYNLSLGEEELKLAEIHEKFATIIEGVKTQNPELEINNIVKEGKIYKEIIHQAEAFSDSYIITSTHGASGWEQFFTGSNAYKIAASSSKPVFTIRGKNIPSQIKHIVLPIDSTPETREKVPLTTTLAVLLGAKVDILTVTEFDYPDLLKRLNDYALQVSRYMDRFNVENSIHHVNGSNQTDITIDFAQSKRADLISIMTEQETSLSNILLGSSAHQMINKSPIPVLLFPTKQIGIISESFKTEGINY